MKIKETQHYEIRTDHNPYSEAKDAVEYIIVNKETGVIEADSRMMPMAKKYLMELEAYYGAVEDMEEDGFFDEEGLAELSPNEKFKFN